MDSSLQEVIDKKIAKQNSVLEKNTVADDATDEAIESTLTRDVNNLSDTVNDNVIENNVKVQLGTAKTEIIDISANNSDKNINVEDTIDNSKLIYEAADDSIVSEGSLYIENNDTTITVDEPLIKKLEITDAGIASHGDTDEIKENTSEVTNPTSSKNLTVSTREDEFNDKNISPVSNNDSNFEKKVVLLPIAECNTGEENSNALKNKDLIECDHNEVYIGQVLTPESSQPKSEEEEDSPNVKDVSIEETISIIEKHVLNETIESSDVEETSLDDTIIINGMPVLQKEVTSEEDIKTDSKSNTIESLLVTTSPEESESIEVIREEATASQVREEKALESSQKEIFIPPHILGHNLDRPVAEDHIRNGKVRKPRLGVKIPYRNLTSQIVSRKDIEEEVMERSRLRNATADIPSGGDIFFAKKLTQRLAKKLTTKPKNTEKSSGSKTAPTTSTAVDVKPFLDPSDKITDNSDLIALLEGDDVDWPPKKSVEKRTPEWERETALKQLRELPKQGKSGRTSILKAVAQCPSGKTSTSSTEPTGESTSPIDDNTEPKFSIGVVTKTYTRKRKASSDIKFLTATIIQSQKKIVTDKNKPSATSSSPSTPKQSDKSTSQKITETSPKLQKLKQSSPDNKEMPALKRESSVVNEEKQSNQKIQKISEEIHPQISPEKSNPQVIITKTITQTISKTPDLTPKIQQIQHSPNTYISKSSRIVKKKKIWDPDEDIVPKYVKPVSRLPRPLDGFEKKVEKATEKKVEKVPEKKNEKVIEKKAESVTKKVDALETPTKLAVLKPSNERATPKKVMKVMKKKKPKRLTEIDRLLMDEGAVKLLYAVKTDDVQSVGKKKQLKGIISLDRAQRELLNKTNEIKNDLQMSSTIDSPISLRKKELPVKTSNKEVAGTILQRKKSTSSAHSPPASPAFYNQHAEASRIIRRHSSSSFSSENSDGEENLGKPSSKKSETLKKKMKTHSERHSSSMGVDKQLLSEEMAKNFNKIMPVEYIYTQLDTLNIKTYQNFVQIILTPCGRLRKTTLSIEGLKELTTIITELKNDNTCRAVLLSSSGSAFCQGIDYKELVVNDKEECTLNAKRYAQSVRDFLLVLLNFPKILVAGVHGHTIGLGVTMLPLFDMVLASDTATFSTPYASLGCVAEGGSLLSNITHNALGSELFYASRKLTASEAYRLGLVTRTLWPDKFQDELIASLKMTSGQSLNCMKAIKEQIRGSLKSVLIASLEKETDLLTQCWIGEECQLKFLDYNVESK